MADSILMLKSALEFARFQTPELRQKVYDTIDRLDADLQAHDYEFDVTLDTVFEQLEETVKECEEADVTEAAVDAIINGEDNEEVEVIEVEDNEDDKESIDELEDEDDDTESLDTEELDD